MSGLFRRRAPAPRAAPPAGDVRRILFPFTADSLSRRALDASLRLARAEQATLVPVLLATVAHHLPLDAPLPRQAALTVGTQEAIEQRAAAFDVAVDARVARGRSARHALRAAIDDERYDRLVIAAAAPGAPGFAPGDVAWLLANAPGEIVVLRPAEPDSLLDEEQEPPGPGAFGITRTVAVPPSY